LHSPVSALKALRRQGVAALREVVLQARRHAVAAAPITAQLIEQAAHLHARRPWLAPDRPQLVPLVRSDAQLDAVIASGLPEVILDWMELVGLTRAVDKARAAGLRVVLATVRIQKPGEDGIDRRLQRLGPDGVLVRHWGGLMQFATSEPAASAPRVHGDFSLNVSNSVTAHHLWALGADTLALAHDLDETQVHRVLDRVPPGRVEVIAHHHIPTFHTEHCVYAHLLSHGRDFRSCGRPCEQHAVALQDHQGLDHPVVVDVGCRNTVFNARAQSAASAVPRLIARGVRRFRIELVREDFDTTTRLLAAYQALLDGRMEPRTLLHSVGVHEQFGVTAGTLRTFARPA
jgi:putative protease